MTTIAATKTQIAGDLQATHSGGLKFKLTTKIHEFYQPLVWPVKFYVGMCGDIDYFPSVIQFLTDPTQFKRPPKGNGDFLVLTSDKHIFTFKRPDQWTKVDQKFYAVGTGMNYAMAAMESGKTPVEAVKIAGKFDLYTGMGIKHYDIK